MSEELKEDPGRYTLWEVAWKDFAAHPILGVGTQN